MVSVTWAPRATAADEPFTADRCAGETIVNPAASGPTGFENLLLIDGARLDAFNAGNPVPLYDYAGYADDQAYPPLCTLLQDESGNPVSEWMFCTDVWSKVCGQTGEDGALLENGQPINPVTDVGANPRLTEAQERLISWLIHNEVPYSGTGVYDYGVTTARANVSYNERAALQALIWCISDMDEASYLDYPASLEGRGADEQDRLTTCVDNMDLDRQAG